MLIDQLPIGFWQKVLGNTDKAAFAAWLLDSLEQETVVDPIVLFYICDISWNNADTEWNEGGRFPISFVDGDGIRALTFPRGKNEDADLSSFSWAFGLQDHWHVPAAARYTPSEHEGVIRSHPKQVMWSTTWLKVTLDDLKRITPYQDPTMLITALVWMAMMPEFMEREQRDWIDIALVKIGQALTRAFESMDSPNYRWFVVTRDRRYLMVTDQPTGPWLQLHGDQWSVVDTGPHERDQLPPTAWDPSHILPDGRRVEAWQRENGEVALYDQDGWESGGHPVAIYAPFDEAFQIGGITFGAHHIEPVNRLQPTNYLYIWRRGREIRIPVVAVISAQEPSIAWLLRPIDVTGNIYVDVTHGHAPHWLLEDLLPRPRNPGEPWYRFESGRVYFRDRPIDNARLEAIEDVHV